MPGGRMADSPTGNSMGGCYIELDGAVFAIRFSCRIGPFDSAVRTSVRLLLDGCKGKGHRKTVGFLN